MTIQWREGYHPKSTGKPQVGFVYLLRSSNGFFKIGKSKNPERRIKQLRKQYDLVEIECICLIPTNHMAQLELDLHSEFLRKRVNYTEWFLLTPADVEFIKGLAS